MISIVTASEKERAQGLNRQGVTSVEVWCGRGLRKALCTRVASVLEETSMEGDTPVGMRGVVLGMDAVFGGVVLLESAAPSVVVYSIKG